MHTNNELVLICVKQVTLASIYLTLLVRGDLQAPFKMVYTLNLMRNL